MKMEKVILAVLLVCFATLAMATDRQPATVGEYAGLSQVRTDLLNSNTAVTRCAKVTGYYYYSGSIGSSGNGFANEDDTLVPDSHIYQPFSVVSKGTEKHLTVTGLCINSLDTAGVGIDNPTPYEVRFGAKVGSGGTLVCSGNATSSDDPTGRGGFGVNEYTHAVKIRKCKLAGSAKKGTQYHMNVTPQCFKNQVCGNARYFEDTDDSSIDHIGPPTNRGHTLWSSGTFGEHWVYPGAPSFSAGVTGSLTK